MLEELLLNFSTRDLETRRDRTEIAFNHLENFEDTFQRILYQELDMNKKDSKKQADKALPTIRSEFKKTSSKIEEERKIQNRAPAAVFSKSLRKSFNFHLIHLKPQICQRLDQYFTTKKKKIQDLILT